MNVETGSSASLSIRHSARRVSDRYGVSLRTLSRWLASDRLHFPQPLVINGRRYWTETDLTEWERARASLMI